MRTICLLLMLAACTGAPPAPAPGASLDALRASVAAWRASPDPANLDEVGISAAQAQAVPPGDRALDLELGATMADVLLRPDLAIARLEPLAPTLTAAESDGWLSALLRAGELERFAAEVERLHGAALDPGQEGLVAAAAQARTHRGVDWRSAVRSHDASALASRQVMIDRAPLERPVPSLAGAIDALHDALPGWRIALATTRSVAPTEAHAADTPGAIPASRGRRRIVGYADGSSKEQVLATAEELERKRPPRVVGVILGATHPDGQSMTVCAEGRFDDGRLWLTAGCSKTRETAWLDAAERWTDLGNAGITGAERASEIRNRFGETIGATP